MHTRGFADPLAHHEAVALVVALVAQLGRMGADFHLHRGGRSLGKLRPPDPIHRI